MSEVFDDFIEIQDNGVTTIRLNGNQGNLRLGGGTRDGDLTLRDNTGADTVHLNGQEGNLRLGGGARDGDLTCLNHSGDVTVHIDGGQGNLMMGANGVDGDISLFPSSATDLSDWSQATIRLDGQEGNLRLGGGTRDGDLTLRDNTGADTVHLNGQEGNLRLGGGARDGDLTCLNHSGDVTVHIDGGQGNLMMGANGVDGDISLFPSSATDLNDWSQATIRLDANTGDIRLSGADCAERFDIADEQRVEPGDVLIVGDGEELVLSLSAYDRRVLGVVSGAGGYKPGLILDSSKEMGRAPVALMGKVFCKVDASEHPIKAGDMLTTSDRRGFAMKAADPTRAFGAVLGKALRSLASGQGLIPVLVALQ